MPKPPLRATANFRRETDPAVLGTNRAVERDLTIGIPIGAAGPAGELDPRKMPRRVMARVVRLDPGRIDVSELLDRSGECLGLLIMDGLLLIELDAGRGSTAWLVGAEDLLRPWELDDAPLLCERSWRVLAPTRLALLDHDFALRARGDPAIWNWSLARLAQTTHWLLAKTLLLSSPTVEERLALLFTLLAERWGRVTPDGIRIALPLTHTVLARLIGSRRPTVSLALKTLREQGVLIRTPDQCYLLRRTACADQPAEASCWSRCMLALGV